MMDITPTAAPPVYSDNWANVQPFIQLFFPQFLDPTSPQYVDPKIMAPLWDTSDEARTWCLPSGQQDIAQAYFIAYLVTLRNETTSGIYSPPVAGPVTMEKEGDIQVQYASTIKTGTQTMSQRPPSDPWDVWNRFWMRCAVGTITTRFGDPVKNGTDFTWVIWQRAMNVWYPLW